MHKFTSALLLAVICSLTACTGNSDKKGEERAARILKSTQVVNIAKQQYWTQTQEDYKKRKYNEEYYAKIEIITNQFQDSGLNNFIYQILTADKQPLKGNLTTALTNYAAAEIKETVSDVQTNDYKESTLDTKDLQLTGSNGKYLNLLYVTTNYSSRAAHPNWGLQNIVLSTDNFAAVPLEAILINKEAETELLKLQLAALAKVYSARNNESEEDTEREIYEWIEKKPSTNWRFGEGGLVFSYSPYEVGPFSWGEAEITIPREQLKNIIKPQVLKTLDAWQANPQQKPYTIGVPD